MWSTSKPSSGRTIDGTWRGRVMNRNTTGGDAADDVDDLLGGSGLRQRASRAWLHCLRHVPRGSGTWSPASERGRRHHMGRWPRSDRGAVRTQCHPEEGTSAGSPSARIVKRSSHYPARTATSKCARPTSSTEQGRYAGPDVSTLAWAGWRPGPATRKGRDGHEPGSNVAP